MAAYLLHEMQLQQHQTATQTILAVVAGAMPSDAEQEPFLVSYGSAHHCSMCMHVVLLEADPDARPIGPIHDASLAQSTCQPHQPGC